MISELENALKKNQPDFHKVVEFNPAKDKLYPFDFSSANHELTTDTIANTDAFSSYINQKLENKNCKYGIGGYNENRTLYRRSELFDEANRSIHLGIDIWGPADTKVYAPLGGMVHSFAFNNEFGDYGATLILLHQLESIAFHTLYGHLSLKDIAGLSEGAYISRGQVVGHFGEAKENGHWPPHLHFQIINEMNGWKGDYPGVAAITEREKYLANNPDADLILNMMKYVK